MYLSRYHIRGYASGFEAEGSPTFHHYPVGVRLVY